MYSEISNWAEEMNITDLLKSVNSNHRDHLQELQRKNKTLQKIKQNRIQLKEQRKRETGFSTFFSGANQESNSSLFLLSLSHFPRRNKLKLKKEIFFWLASGT